MTDMTMHRTADRRDSEVSLLRLYVLRATYLLIVFGLGKEIWPGVLHHAKPWSLMQGVAVCILATVTILAALGLRYPLKLLPLLFFDMIWKALWLLVVALPLWQEGKLDPVTMQTVIACAMGIIFPIVIPWGYVAKHYLRAPGDRWW